jgi:manganese/zinc/iron transport system permease protein
LTRLARNGWVEKAKSGCYRLTIDGIHRAAYIIRLHRLWEVYLADYLGIGAERVHRSAEEMEHIITPEIETELTRLLKDPKIDPHHQPIPPLG